MFLAYLRNVGEPITLLASVHVSFQRILNGGCNFTHSAQPIKQASRVEPNTELMNVDLLVRI